jgi:hypothetical protein
MNILYASLFYGKRTEATVLMIQLLCFWTLSIVLFLFKTERFGDCILPPSSGKSQFSWAQSIEVVSAFFIYCRTLQLFVCSLHVFYKMHA